MTLEYNPVIPPDVREKINSYLKTLKEDKHYPAFYINDRLEVIDCIGVISNNGSWNYHNNYDDSKNTHYVLIDGRKVTKWFLLDKEDALNLQVEFIKEWQEILRNEYRRLLKISIKEV